MRVLHVISDENIGGAGVLLTSLLHNFDRTRVESVVALPKNSALIPRIQASYTDIHLLEHPTDRVSLGAIREMRRLILRISPDIVHTNAAIAARIAARLCRKPIVHTRHCCFPLSGIWRVPPIRICGGFWNRMLSDRVIATAEAAKKDLRQLGIPDWKIEVIVNGSEAIRELSESEKTEIRRLWGISATDFTVGICARLTLCKGHRTFLQAARLLCDVAPLIPFRFLVVGEGEERDALMQYAKELGLSERVVFTGFVEDMASVYRILRLNVNCSVGTETSCLAISEGMSAGVPCIVSDYGGNRAMIGDSQAGFVYPLGDAVMLAKLILKVATDPSLEQEMRRAAHARYLECYTARGMADGVTALYRSLTERKTK